MALKSNKNLYYSYKSFSFPEWNKSPIGHFYNVGFIKPLEYLFLNIDSNIANKLKNITEKDLENGKLVLQIKDLKNVLEYLKERFQQEPFTMLESFLFKFFIHEDQYKEFYNFLELLISLPEEDIKENYGIRFKIQ